MMPPVPATIAELTALLKKGEGRTLEFKRSTAELREGLKTACAFLNGSGGLVLFGVRSDARPEGQQVSDKTLREIAEALGQFEPPVNIEIARVSVAEGREVLILPAAAPADSMPFTFEGRPFERSGSTTRKMSQERYEQLLMERMHTRRRWENQPAEMVPRDIDRDEAFRFAEIARSSGRLIGPAARNLPDLLDRLGLRKNGEILRAAVVLFGKHFMPDYPQCELRMARFRGTDKAEFLDQRQVRGPAFRLLEEAELFCQRHFPLPARIVPGQMRRVERHLIPPDAMREILVNALIHRDYSIAGGAVSLAIFDDRVEVWSAGTYPRGITAESLSREHLSVQRNPIIADVFFRAGLIEKWGRGTNRVIEMCRAAGVAAPVFEEITGAAVVTFRVAVGRTAQIPATSQLESQLGSELESKLESLDRRVLATVAGGPLGKGALAAALGQRQASGPLHQSVRTLLARGFLEQTIPDKPNSRLQQYRITTAGKQILEQERK